MHLHEYQAKELMREVGIPVPPFVVISNLTELGKIPWEEGVVKVQIHAGGRGKAGGVKIAKNRKELEGAVRELLGKKIVNVQTGPMGMVARQVMVTRSVDIKNEYYVAAYIDRREGVARMMAAPGGVDIEERAELYPESVKKVEIGLDGKVDALALDRHLQLEGRGAPIFEKVARLFKEKEATLIEINPLVEEVSGGMKALDAKMTLDEDALFRHPDIARFNDPTQWSENEQLARELDLSYVALEGTVGCMVNGAGLAMATMDLLAYHGGKPANFLDVGGSATQDKIEGGFKIILSDRSVRSVFVNIFGGIMDCALIAKAFVEATRKTPTKIPFVVRLEGTNADKGKAILKESGLALIAAKSLDEGARLAVEAAR